MTDSIKIAEGHAAAALLANPDFLSVIASLRAQSAWQIEQSQPHQKDEREYLYNQLRGLAAIEQELTIRVNTKDRLEAPEDAEVEDDEHYR